MFVKTSVLFGRLWTIEDRNEAKQTEESEFLLYSILEELSLKSVDIDLPREHMQAK